MRSYLESIMIQVLFRDFRPNGPRYHSPGRSPGYVVLTTLEALTGRAIRFSAARWAFRGSPRAAPWAMIVRPVGPSHRTATEQNRDRSEEELSVIRPHI